MKDKITKNEYLQIAGLLALGQRYGRQVEECDEAISKIFESKANDFYGHWSDAIWENTTIDQLLDKMGVIVEENCSHVWDVPRTVCAKCKILYSDKEK